MEINIYQKRVIAFVDILGFKEVLKEEERAKDILDILRDLKEFSRKGVGYDRAISKSFAGLFGDKQITLFSDSIIISEPVGNDYSVVQCALKVSQLLLKKGFLCGGAILCADLYHNDDVLFGMGLIKAYSHESKLAKYPRIIIGKSCFNNLKNNFSDFYDALVETDKDGTRFINILANTSDYNEDDVVRLDLSKLVEDGYKKLKNEEEKLNEKCKKDGENESDSYLDECIGVGVQCSEGFLSIKQKITWLANEYNLKFS